MLSKRVRVILLAPILFAVTAWAALVLLFAGPGEAAWARPSLASAYALLSVAALLWLRPFWKALAVWGAALIAVLIWWGTLRPSNEREWRHPVRGAALDGRLVVDGEPGPGPRSGRCNLCVNMHAHSAERKQCCRSVYASFFWPRSSLP